MGWRERLDKLKQTAKDHNSPIHKDSGTKMKGWQLILTRENAPNGSTHWHLSVMLVPIGRGSVDKDWKWLGQITAYLGAPDEPLYWPQPNRPHHWDWLEENN